MHPIAPLAGRLPLYLLAFLVPPMTAMLLIGTTAFSSLNRHRTPEALDPKEAPLPAPAAVPAGVKPVVILLSNSGTQLTEALVSHELLAREAGLPVVTCAPLRVLSAATAPVGLLPDYAIEQCPEPAAIVIPSMTDPLQRSRAEWLKKHGPSVRSILALGEGARLAAQAGLTEGRRVAAHFTALAGLRAEFPGTRWESGRVIRDGSLLSSEGGLSSFDATLALIEAERGAEAAREIRERVGWPSTASAEGAETAPAALKTFLPLVRNATLHWWRRRVAVLLTPDMDGLRLALALDPLPRSMNSQAYTVAEFRAYVPTRGGLALVPSVSVGQAELADAVLAPGSEFASKPAPYPDSFKNSLTGQWLEAHQLEVEPMEDAPTLAEYARRVYRRLERWDGRDTTVLVAQSFRLPDSLRASWLAEPTEPGDLRNALPVLLLLGAGGVLAARWLERRRASKSVTL